jgi:1-aminocyclopropane-1-carboxylate deaminase
MLPNNYINHTQIGPHALQADWLNAHDNQLDVLRLDTLHPIVSGNKWFKLQHYLQAAKPFGKIATFGGAFSNHIVATAFAAKQAGLACKGIIRGEESNRLSPSLQTAKEDGMELQFVSRADFNHIDTLKNKLEALGFYVIDPGGYGQLGAKGAADILQQVELKKYDHIICSVGSGTMMAGLIKAALPNQMITGISSMKHNESLLSEVQALLTIEEKQKNYQILHDFHFGGFAKTNPTLIQFMNNWFAAHQMPTDIVYTSKLFFAIEALTKTNFFGHGTCLLAIHSGGLQGNQSVKDGSLHF